MPGHRLGTNTKGVLSLIPLSESTCLRSSGNVMLIVILQTPATQARVVYHRLLYSISLCSHPFARCNLRVSASVDRAGRPSPVLCSAIPGRTALSDSTQVRHQRVVYTLV